MSEHHVCAVSERPVCESLRFLGGGEVFATAFVLVVDGGRDVRFHTKESKRNVIVRSFGEVTFEAEAQRGREVTVLFRRVREAQV